MKNILLTFVIVCMIVATLFIGVEKAIDHIRPKVKFSAFKNLG